VILGVADGDTAELERFGAEEIVRVDLSVSGDELSGTVEVWDVQNECEIVGTIDGTRRSSACDDGGGSGNFDGYWNIVPTPISNGCDLPVEPDCDEFQQDGNTVHLFGSDLTGTVSGNTLTIHSEELVDETLTMIVDATVQLSQDGNSFSGTLSISYVDSANPEANCQTVAALAGSRTTACPQSARGDGWELLGLSAEAVGARVR
jgi:hypothetical protein